MPEKKPRSLVKQMSQVKDDLLQQALQQVKVLKAKLESSEQTDMSLLQKANEQIEALRKELNVAEAVNRKLQANIRDLESIKSGLENSEKAMEHRLAAALQQVQTLRSQLESLERENEGLKKKSENDARTDPEINESTQLTINLLDPTFKDNANATNQSTVEEISASTTSEIQVPSVSLTAQEKVALFAGLFARRRDQYAERWESHSTGKNGYSPAREHYEFHGKRPCPGPPACPNLPLTDYVLKEHLQGKKTIGVYPMLEDETCVFVAIDLDQKNKNRITECRKVTEPWREHPPVPKRELDIKSERVSSATDGTWSWKDDACRRFDKNADIWR